MQNAKKQLFRICFSTLFAAFSVINVFASPNDIKQHWAENTINTWIEQGYISGYPDGSFQPDNTITRAEFVTLANKAYQYYEKTDVSFHDVLKEHWAYPSIQTGVCAGYITGDENGTFRPDEKVSRAEAASMIARLQNITANENKISYSDNDNIPAWAQNAIFAVSQKNIMKGFPDGSFQPQKYMTRAEAVTALSMALQNNSENNTKNDSENDSKQHDTQQQTQQNQNQQYDTQQNLSITLEKNTMQNETIINDLIIPESMGNEQIILDHVTINGTLLVSGGGTVSMKGCNINQIELKQPNVVIDADVSSNINTVLINTTARINGDSYKKAVFSNEISSPIRIDADIELLDINAPITLKLLNNADIKTLRLSEKATNSNIDFTDNARVKECILYGKTKITGKAGIIDTLTVYVNGVETDIKPEELFLREAATKITYTFKEAVKKTPSTDTTAKERLVLNTDGQGFQAGGKTYKSATINAQNTSLSNAVINEDVTIQQSIGETNATLKQVTVHGNVNINGGKSVDIQKCNLQNVISHRRDRTPIILSFDSETEVDNVIIRGNTVLKGDIILKNVSVEQYSGRKLEIDTNIKNIDFDTTAVAVQLNENKTIDTLKVASAPNTLKIHMLEGSVIDTLYSDANVEITGTGTINKIVTDKEISIEPSITRGNLSSSFVAVTNIDSIPTTMYKGKSITLSGVIKPLDASKKAIRWSIKDAGDTGAVLSDGNVLTAFKEGTVVVTAQIRGGLGGTKNFKQNFVISVEDEFADFVSVEDITMTSPTTWDINEPLSLSAEVIPSSATNTFITWSIKNDNHTKSKIIDNVLTSKLTGVVTVQAEIKNAVNGTSNFRKEFQINIIPIEEKFVKVENIILNTPNSCKAGDTLTLSGVVEPSNADLKNIQWQVVSAGTTGAYIQNHINLHTKSPGNIVISATIDRGGNGSSKSYYQEFIITVK